jgi:hypothetical protein
MPAAGDGIPATFDQPVGHHLVALRGGAAESDRERRGKCDTRERQGEDQDQRNRRSPLFQSASRRTLAQHPDGSPA